MKIFTDVVKDIYSKTNEIKEVDCLAKADLGFEDMCLGMRIICNCIVIHAHVCLIEDGKTLLLFETNLNLN